MKSTLPKFTFQQVVHGYTLAANARHLSPNTLADYANTFKMFAAHAGQDIIFSDITNKHIEAFLASKQGLTNKTLLNYHTGLAALWTWALSEKLAETHVVRAVHPPKPEKREIIPFTESEVKVMLSVVARSKAYDRPGKRRSDHAVPNADRNRAILLLLVDTGLRASELCRLMLHQVDQRNSRVQVLGKGAVERSIPFSPRTGQALWRYLARRPNALPSDPVFVTALNRPLDRGQLLNLVEGIGQRAGVTDVHPHRFRHTFAIQYLRNGGDPYTLQRLLGHSSLDMVKEYLALAQVDLDNAHRRASPVDNWRL